MASLAFALNNIATLHSNICLRLPLSCSVHVFSLARSLAGSNLAPESEQARATGELAKVVAAEAAQAHL